MEGKEDVPGPAAALCLPRCTQEQRRSLETKANIAHTWVTVDTMSGAEAEKAARKTEASPTGLEESSAVPRTASKASKWVPEQRKRIFLQPK